MGRYFYVLESSPIQQIEVEMKKYVNDTISMKLVCNAFYNEKNEVDSIICFKNDTTIFSRYDMELISDGYRAKETYYNKIENSEIYRISTYIKDKESSLYYTNNKNHKGYKIATKYDSCCIESGKLWFTNDTLTERHFYRNIYDEKYSCEDYCSKISTRIYNEFNSINLDINYMSSNYYDNYKAKSYEEIFLGKQFITISEDTILITQTDSVNFYTQTSKFQNDTISFVKTVIKSLNGYGANSTSEWINHKNYTRREDIYYFDGLGQKNSIKKHDISINHLYATENYRGNYKTPIDQMELNVSNENHYKYDSKNNWVIGEFEIKENEKTIVKRKIKYN